VREEACTRISKLRIEGRPIRLFFRPAHCCSLFSRCLVRSMLSAVGVGGHTECKDVRSVRRSDPGGVELITCSAGSV